MLSIILSLVLIWALLSGIMAAWTLFIQGYLYSEPVEQVLWRAPAAGALLTLFLGFWVMLATKYPGRYDILSEFSDRETAAPYKQLIAVIDGKELEFKLGRAPDGRYEYRRGNRVLPSRPEKLIVVEESGERYVFLPERDAEGHNQVGKNQRLHYWDSDHKRWMEEGFFGQVETYHASWLMGNLLLNFGHLAVWFLCLWLVLGFQWPHAFGQAIPFWLVTMLCVVPPMLAKAAAVASAR